MSIFKESFHPNIRKQLDRRQRAMVERTPQDLVYINGRNAWIRMSSAVNTYKKDLPYPPSLKDLKNISNYDNSLAKKYILLGGTLKEDKTLKYGIGDFNNAYSLQSAEVKNRLGIKPMPGINNIEVKSRGAYGSLRTVTVNFQCWDIHQLEDLELLYMRPGYTVLVEWGWIPYYDENNIYSSIVEPYDIVDKTKTKEQIWKDLEEKQQKNGNYEAMFGYVKNYSWNARPDGGYDCTTEIISLGEVIESLKVNYSPSIAISTIKEKGLISPNLTQISISEINSNNTIEYATRIAAYIVTAGLSEAGIWLFNEDEKEKLKKAYTQNILAGIFYELYTIAAKASPNTEDKGKEIIFKDNKKGPVYTLFHKTININSDSKDDDKTVGESDEQYYISLESLVEILNNYVLLQDGKNQSPFSKLSVKDDTYKGTPDIKTGNGYLLGLAHPLQLSIDPRVCLIKNNLWANGIKINYVTGDTNTNTGDPLIVFNHNLKSVSYASTPEEFVKTIIRNVIPASKVKNKEALKKFIYNYLRPNGDESNLENNLKEVTKQFNKLYKTYKIEKPNLAATFDLEFTEDSSEAKNFIGKTLMDRMPATNTFYDLLQDSAAANLEDDDINYIIGKTGNEIIDGDPERKEIERLEKEKANLEEKAEDAKEGNKFLNNIPLPYYYEDKYENELGIIGNIFINIKLLYELSLDNNLESQDKKEKNEIALYDFIKNILSRISTSIGNINNFDLFIEPNNNVAKIIDINYVDKDPKNTYDNAFQLEIHNLQSIVRSYKLESKIFPEQANIVAIGAQVEGGALGTDTTSLVAFNRSIIDRIIPEKNSYTDTIVSNEANAKLNNLLANLGILYEFSAELESGIVSDSDFNAEKASEYANALKDLITFFKTIVTSKTNNKAILPTVLSVDMDGIGGLVIGQVFKVSPDILPKGYKGVGNGGLGSNLGYIVTGIGHSVNNDWVTKVEAQTIIMDSPESEIKNFDYSNITININPTTEKTIIPTGTNTPSNSASTQGVNNPAGQSYRVDPSYKSLIIAAKKSVGFSTAAIPETKGGNVGCAAAVSVMFLRATGFQIHPAKDIELSTYELYNHLSQNSNWIKRSDWRQAQPGDIIVTSRNTSTDKAGHTGIVIDTKSNDGSYTIISNSSKGFLGSQPGTIQPNYSVKKWVDIYNRNPSQTAAFQYIGSYK